MQAMKAMPSKAAEPAETEAPRGYITAFMYPADSSSGKAVFFCSQLVSQAWSLGSPPDDCGSVAFVITAHLGIA